MTRLACRTLDEDYLILSTIHSAKGQEWKSVFLLNVVDGCIPSDLGTGSTPGAGGGAAIALRRDDAGEGRSASRRAASLLHAWPECLRRSARLRLPGHASFRPALLSRFENSELAAGRRRRPPGRKRRQVRIDVSARMRAMWR